MVTHIIPEGTSEPQDFALLDNGAVLVGTGLTVALEIVLHPAAVVSTPPTVAWLSTIAGTVRVSGTETLAVGTYYVRFKLTDAGGEIGFVPNSKEPLAWRVVPVPERTTP